MESTSVYVGEGTTAPHAPGCLKTRMEVITSTPAKLYSQRAKQLSATYIYF